MSTLRISDAPLLPDVDGTEKIPTGGRGDYAVTLDQVKTFARGGIQEALDLKADKVTTYTKIEVDTSLGLKADKSDTYTKTEVDNSLTAIAGGHKAYQTLALAQADQASLPANTVVEVTNDPTSSNNGTYQWNGTTLTKSAYDPLTQAKEYTNDKTTLPITFLEKRNNVTVDLSFKETSNVLWRLVKDVSVLNANSYEYYRISFLEVTKADGDLYNIHFQLDSVLRKDVETRDTRSFIGDVMVQSRSGIGDAVFVVNASPSNIQLRVTIDTDKIEQSNGTVIALWTVKHRGYCYIINPDRYVINDKQSISISRNTIGSGEPITESTAYHIDPRTNVQTMIGSPFSNGYRNALVSNVRAQSEFVFPQFIETGGSIIAFDQSSDHIEIPISRMTTRAEDSDAIVQTFTPAHVSVHGIRRFIVRSPRPIYSRLIGSIELLVKLPAEDTVEDYRLTLQAPNGIGYNSSRNTSLGYASSLETREPQTINSLNILGSYLQEGYYDQELLDMWLSGKWIKLSIPINADVALFDGIGYRFMLWIAHVSGTKRTNSNVGNAACIVLNGAATLNHDISPMLNHRYYHLLTGI